MHESGKPRPAQWLALTDDQQTLRQQVVRVARQALDADLPPTERRRIWDRMIHPGPGDLVVEVATSHRVTQPGFDPLASDWYRGVGFLIAVRDEWAHTADEFAAGRDEWGYGPDERPVERRVFYVQYGPAPVDVCRWVNADFYAVPTEWS